MEICIYCGEPRADKIGCCGENHFEISEELKDEYAKKYQLLDIPKFIRNGENMKREFDTCQFCSEKRPDVTAPKDPRPYVCLKHRHLSHKVWNKTNG